MARQTKPTMDTDPTPTPTPAQTSPPSNPSPKGSRRIWWILVGVSLVTIIVSGISLGNRIGNYNKESDHALYAYIPIASTTFTFANRPVELIEDTVDDKAVIRVRYGDEELVLDVSIPPLVPLPSLYERQKDWLTLSFFADRSGLSMSEFQRKLKADEIRPRLALVTRTPFGVEPLKEKNHESLEQPENWGTGEIRRDLWRFDCYEFLRDGSIVHEVKRFPESGASLLRRQNYAKLKGEPIPQRSEGELDEYSWQRGAALKIMPRAPAITFEQQPLLVAGWTLPVTAGSILVFFVSFFFAIAPARTVQ